MLTTGGSEALAAGHVPEAPVGCDFPLRALAVPLPAFRHWVAPGIRRIRAASPDLQRELPSWESEVLFVYLFTVCTQWMKEKHYSGRKPQVMVGLGAGEDIRPEELSLKFDYFYCETISLKKKKKKNLTCD